MKIETCCIKKLKSQSGASITFALLLFLVCSVLSGVILVAATTASGRMAKMAESDQRYYAVMSAAELMIDLIDGKTVTIVKETVKTKIKTYNSENTIIDPEHSVWATGATSEYLLQGVSGDQAVVGLTSDKKILEGASSPLVKEDLTCILAYGFYAENEKVSKSFPLEYTFTVKSSLGSGFLNGSSDPVEVNIVGRMDENGNIVLTISNVGKDATSKDKFYLQMDFSADLDQETYSNTSDGPKESADSGRYKVTTTSTVQEATTLTWSLTGTKTASAPTSTENLDADPGT